MYYGLIMLSVIMFGGCFALNDAYQKLRGSSLKTSMQFSFVGSLASILVLSIINGFRIEFTWFTFLMALLSATNGFVLTYCSFKALGSINLSLYSLFTMLGGMVLPFIQGIVFYSEGITAAKIICFALICLALALTVNKGESKGGTIYYIGIFVLNGMCGVLSKIFAASPYEKTSAAGYSMLSSICTLSIALLCLAIFFRNSKNEQKHSVLSISLNSLCGSVNVIANLILVIALSHVDASVQYPMVTGGVIIVSTIFSLFGKNKPSKKEILSVFIAFLGLLAVFIIPV